MPLFASNFLAPLVLPAATDPPGLFRFLAAHLASVAMAGIFAAVSFLALEGVLVGLMGDRGFRRISLLLQGLAVVVLLTMLFLYPVLSGSVHGVLESGTPLSRWTPPLWFLGLDQRILDGPATPLVFARLARTAILATLLASGFAVLSYPLAWWRKTRDLIEGNTVHCRRTATLRPGDAALHATIVRSSSARAIWHFIGLNLVRVPRYRMVLVMAGGMGTALVLAAVTRVRILHGHVGFIFPRQGWEFAVPIIAFWTVAGLRSTFLAPSDQRGRWIFRVTAGKGGLEEYRAIEKWVRTCALSLTWTAVLWACFAAPAPYHTWTQTLTQLTVAGALSLLLTDAFFLNVHTIPFTGTRSTSASSFALLLIPYVGFFPAVVFLTVGAEPWISSSPTNLLLAALLLVAAHFCVSGVRRTRIAEHLQQSELEEDEEEFPLRLGLRY